MYHSFTKLYIHLILVGNDRMALIIPEKEKAIYNNIKTQIEKTESTVLEMNGTQDHIHILINMSPKISLSELSKQIKGASSHWINQNRVLSHRFSWQKGIRGFSIGYSRLNATKKYIRNQKEHHKKNSFAEELDYIINLYK